MESKKRAKKQKEVNPKKKQKIDKKAKGNQEQEQNETEQKEVKQNMEEEKQIAKTYDYQVWVQNFYLESDQFKQIYQKVAKEYETIECYPPWELVFSAFQLTPIDKIKVVILGQDPYIDEGQAMGMCFSVPKNIKAPPSLVNIYKAIEQDDASFKRPNHGDLTK